MLTMSRDRATAIIAPGARHSRAVAAAQAGDQLTSKLTARLRVDGVVDGFVGHVALRLVGEYTLQGTRDLLGDHFQFSRVSTTRQPTPCMFSLRVGRAA